MPRTTMSEHCEICLKKTDNSRKYYCGSCKKLLGKKSTIKRERKKALGEKKSNKKDGDFYCYYTGIKLIMDNPCSAFYRSFDHITPGQPRLVLCSQFINDMKSDTSEGEFQSNVKLLADIFKGRDKPAEKKEFKTKYFRRGG